MKFIRKILDRFRKEHSYPDEFDVWEEVVFNRENVDFGDSEQRHDFLRSCLEQLKDATNEVENLSTEYNTVTSLLKDMEEIEALSLEDDLFLKEAATKLVNINKTRNGYEQKTVSMDEATYFKLDALYDQVEEGVKKLEEAELYQTKIRQDMKHLTGEKEAYTYRKYDLQRLLEDLRGVMIICLTAASLCIALLLILQFGFQMKTQIGYILTAGATAIVMTIIYTQNSNAMRELKRVEKSINKIILLHNGVKIRYINNTNLLEYLHIKYGVSNAAELKKAYDQYLEEKKRREDFRQLEKDLDHAEKEFLRFLRSLKLYDTAIWLHQPAAILDKKEMVEVRHNLIIRRQSLRKRIDYNREVVARKAQDEIKDLVEKFPRYSAEILKLVADYEKKYN